MEHREAAVSRNVKPVPYTVITAAATHLSWELRRDPYWCQTAF